jgi:L-fuculose-phosphate aldolase
MAEALGSIVPYAGYGLPGTKKLIAMVAEALKNNDARALIMSHHGALCFGEDSQRTFETASVLEEVSALQLLTQFKKMYDEDAEDLAQMVALIDKKENASAAKPGPKVTSERRGNSFVITEEGESFTLDLDSRKSNDEKDLPPYATLHRAIYQNRPDINNIIHSYAPEILALSNFDTALKPQVDDFAQIVGPDCKTAKERGGDFDSFAKGSLKAFKGRNAFFIKGKGAFCCGANEDDSEAIEEILQKNSLAFLGTKLFNFYQPISPVEARLMRFVYLKKYSKQAQK